MVAELGVEIMAALSGTQQVRECVDVSCVWFIDCINSMLSGRRPVCVDSLVIRVVKSMSRPLTGREVHRTFVTLIWPYMAGPHARAFTWRGALEEGDCSVPCVSTNLRAISQADNKHTAAPAMPSTYMNLRVFVHSCVQVLCCRLPLCVLTSVSKR